jgi:hypothetical protein
VLYIYLGTQNIMVIRGSASTVGIVGGYIQGGGHSILNCVGVVGIQKVRGK